MVIPDEIRKCVAFLAYRKADGSTPMVGTVFFVAKPLASIPDRFWSYGVTAGHVIHRIRAMGSKTVLMRVNRRNGDAEWVESRVDDWISDPADPSVDVAVTEISLCNSWDHKLLPLDMAAVRTVIQDKKIDVGDEICISGLFAEHFGRKSNIPIVRIGNIAAMPHEKVSTGMGEIDAYLIEARSIGGLSGSPVFVNASGVRHGVLNLAGAPQLFLLGLMHGHFDSEFKPLDTTADGMGRAGVNTGIGIVVPVEKIIEVMQQPEICNREEADERRLREEGLPKMDSRE